MSQVSLKINGKVHSVDVDPKSPLLYTLTDTLALRSPNFGCGLGQCGACSVLVDNKAVQSCIFPVESAVGKEIVTLEGLGTPEKPHPVQKAFIDEQVFQCGYCVNGWVITTKALLDKNPNPSDQEIRSALANLICRCPVHDAIFRAVKRASNYVQGRA
jgi:nicotinate dehydrogenase subunit A